MLSLGYLYFFRVFYFIFDEFLHCNFGKPNVDSYYLKNMNKVGNQIFEKKSLTTVDLHLKTVTCLYFQSRLALSDSFNNGL